MNPAIYLVCRTFDRVQLSQHLPAPMTKFSKLRLISAPSPYPETRHFNDRPPCDRVPRVIFASLEVASCVLMALGLV
jgi:hypothetical protein